MADMGIMSPTLRHTQAYTQVGGSPFSVVNMNPLISELLPMTCNQNKQLQYKVYCAILYFKFLLKFCLSASHYGM